jgi:hypothetical protein
VGAAEIGQLTLQLERAAIEMIALRASINEKARELVARDLLIARLQADLARQADEIETQCRAAEERALALRAQAAELEIQTAAAAERLREMVAKDATLARLTEELKRASADRGVRRATSHVRTLFRDRVRRDDRRA